MSKVNTIFNTQNRDHMTSKLMFDESGNAGTARFDTVSKSHRFVDLSTTQQISFFWVPEEIALEKDRADFMSLTPGEQHIFTSNLKRQIVLDTVQGRAPGLTFLRVVSSPALESFIEAWQFFESIHSRSYSHLIRNVYSDPSAVFDEMLDIKEITDCVNDISKYYQDAYDKITLWEAQSLTGKDLGVTLYDVKRAIWLALVSVNILEGVRFYVSFACSWNFAEQAKAKMAGNASIIKLICRDENVHLNVTQKLINTLPKEDEDFKVIALETKREVVKMFESVIKQEEEWADFLFKDASMIGLNAQILKDYVRWIAAKRMGAIGVTCPYQAPTQNPLPWTSKWISGSKSTQVSPQEVEITSYLSGDVDQDMSEEKLKELSNKYSDI